MTDTMTTALLTGSQLRQALWIAADHLRENAAAVDAINEYPVPDGDTGSNMSATVDRAMEQVASVGEDASVTTILQALAKGALYGARGNSGVILSQSFRGLAAGIGETSTLDARQLAAGMVASAEAAYRAVSKPVEGTMLTVLRKAGEAAQDYATGMENGGTGHACFPVLRAGLAAAEEAEAQTMQMLPELAAAGVPDAGGEGVCVILRGLMAAVTGERPVSKSLPTRQVTIHRSDDHPGFGFCTEFLLEQAGPPLDLELVRKLALANGNTSVVVVGDESLARVHAHSLEPQLLLDAAETLGKLSRVKVEDMAAQNERLDATGSGAGMKSALLAMSHGEGFDALFRDLGAHVAPLGSIVKASAGEIAAAADALRVADVVLLPNHKNVLLAAQQAVTLAGCTIHIVPAATLAQGVAAAIQFDGKVLPAKNLEEMTEVLPAIKTVEVTVALSDRMADGITVKAGQAIALADGTLVAATQSPLEALVAGLAASGVADAELVTVYRGEDAADDSAAISIAIAGVAEDAEVEVLDGGQPLYHYIAAIEA